jgi:hypothetical protein
MSPLALIVFIVLAGLGLWLIDAVIPMEGQVRRILHWVVIAIVLIVVVLWFVGLFGLDLSDLNQPLVFHRHF